MPLVYVALHYNDINSMTSYGYPTFEVNPSPLGLTWANGVPTLGL